MLPVAIRTNSSIVASDMWLEPDSDSDEDVHHTLRLSQRGHGVASDTELSPAMEIYGHYDSIQQSMVMERTIADVEASLQKKAQVCIASQGR